jgi:hypothetical protein
LPEILDEADPNSIQHLIDNPEDLRAVLSNAIRAYERPSNFYLVDVDYDLSLEEAVRVANLSYFDSTNWRGLGNKGKRRIEIALLRLEKEEESYVEADEVVKLLHEMQFRPADLRELLAFASQHPEPQKCKIVAFGSYGFREKYKGFSAKAVPYLAGEESEGSGGWIRYVNYRDTDDISFRRFWPEEFLFAAVRDRREFPMNSP